ncbi:MAG: 1-deoxy-D-xylulose 5-phosphate reductoisomerase [Methyloligella sp.]|nr:MAG: 1-deoxy-D-xylulose 5-phosphate reductoisomerase [Methyloligella sp.]
MDQNSIKSVSILGATGTIGQNTLDLIRRNKEKFQVVAITGNQNIKELVKQAIEFQVEFVATACEEKYHELKEALAETNIQCAAGEQAIIEAATRPVDICMAAIVGVAGLKPTLKALESSELVALANKECLVSAGDLFMQSAKQHQTKLIPVDSEHSAAFQCLSGHQIAEITKLTLTASGGPFRSFSKEQLQVVTKEQALKHPNWEMGAKITIDSATLMNKGLELIEAKHLFSLTANQVDMVVHPQSIIHCLVSFIDGSVLAQLSEPDMRVPIAYSLSWPKRMKTPIEPINLVEISKMDFEAGDEERFPCLKLARQVMETETFNGPALNAANEIAVDAFLSDKCSYIQIPQIIENVLDKMQNELKTIDRFCINDILQTDKLARNMALNLL